MQAVILTGGAGYFGSLAARWLRARGYLPVAESLWEAMADRGVRRPVFSSSCATYGVPSRVPIPEDEAQNPINPYGLAKLALERPLSGGGSFNLGNRSGYSVREVIRAVERITGKPLPVRIEPRRHHPR